MQQWSKWLSYMYRPSRTSSEEEATEPRKIYGRHRELVDRYGISVSQMTTDMFHLS
jgi:hypothetical protein